MQGPRIPGLAAAKAKPMFQRSGREQALIDTVQFGQDHPWPVAFICAPFGGGVAGLLIVDSGWVLRIVAGAVGATLGIALAFLVVHVVFWLRAPTRQREQARRRLSEADRRRRHLLLLAHLERVREVLRGEIEKGEYKQMSGPVPDDTMTWLETENRDLRRRLQELGLPELIPELTVDDERFRTWEGVVEAEYVVHALWYTAIFNDERVLDAKKEGRLDEN